jgi:ArsR family transcriptional regulator
MTDLCKEIAAMGKGIGNENRYRVLEALMKGSLAVGEIAERIGIPQPAVSQHLKVLQSAHLVEGERRGKEIFYSINITYMTKLLKRLADDVSKSK